MYRENHDAIVRQRGGEGDGRRGEQLLPETLLVYLGELNVVDCVALRDASPLR